MPNTALKLAEEYTYRDYLSWDEGERYEIIDGVAYAMSAPTAAHQRISRELLLQFGDFLKDKPCEVFSAPFDVRLFPKEDMSDTIVVQPDLLVVCDPSKLADGKACKGAPDLVIEILSDSTALMDRSIKAEKYRAAGVKEYWMVQPETLEVLVKLLEGGRYASKLRTGAIPVSALPGLTIDMDAVASRLRAQ